MRAEADAMLDAGLHAVLADYGQVHGLGSYALGLMTLVRLGVDFVKVHGQLTRDTYFAIARRAREQGITLAGHVPRVVGSAAASDSGQRSIEHLLAIPIECTPAESIALQPRFSVQGALGRCSSQDLAALYARFVRNDTWVTPTFVAQYEIAGWPGKARRPGAPRRESAARHPQHAAGRCRCRKRPAL